MWASRNPAHRTCSGCRPTADFDISVDHPRPQVQARCQCRNTVNYEVNLAAESGLDIGANRIRAHLAGEIQLNRRVDGDHILILADDERIVDVVDRMTFDERIIIEEAV